MGMKKLESAFLGLIAAGVVLMVVGITLMMTFAGEPSHDSRVSLVERRAVEAAPDYAGHANGDRRAAPLSH
jgi:hypothetical protein